MATVTEVSFSRDYPKDLAKLRNPLNLYWQYAFILANACLYLVDFMTGLIVNFLGAVVMISRHQKNNQKVDQKLISKVLATKHETGTTVKFYHFSSMTDPHIHNASTLIIEDKGSYFIFWNLVEPAKYPFAFAIKEQGKNYLSFTENFPVGARL